MTHVMSDSHEAICRSLFGLLDGDPDDLPEEFVDWYWKCKSAFDRTGTPMGVNDLIWCKVTSSLSGSKDNIVDPPERTFLDVIKEQGLERGAPVEAKWRGGRWFTGTFLFVNGNGKVVVVLDDGTGEERQFSPQGVRLAEPVPIP